MQFSFQRYELKFILTEDTFYKLYPKLKERMEDDCYGMYPICNIYYDTPDYQLIRHSLDKPVYKEKFRLRSYGRISPEEMMFAEIKKKYDGIVYKRRILIKECEFGKLLEEGEATEDFDSQIRKEILQFFHTYPDIRPKAYIGYDRIALTGTDEEKTLRITFDRNISYRENELSLCSDAEVFPVIPEEVVVMEIKVQDSVPLWLASLLSEHYIYKSSFSKYGTYYNQFVAKHLLERIKQLC